MIKRGREGREREREMGGEDKEERRGGGNRRDEGGVGGWHFILPVDSLRITAAVK